MAKLRPVGDDERTIKPKTMVDAAAADERTFLIALRSRLAAELDSGVPAHALRGIVSELRALDQTIRANDVRDNGDDITDATRVPDEQFDPAAI